MAFIGNTSLKSLLQSSSVISDFDENRIKNGAYELSLGSEVFQTDSSPRTIKELKVGEKIQIKPGQFALLLTKEYVKIPNDKIAFISMKAGVKFKGLVNVSGFHVDPGFEGNLLFSVYNAGPSIITLSSGKNYFPIWFAELNESQVYKGNHEKQVRIPDEPVEALSQGDLASPNVLSQRIDENNSAIDKRISVLEKDQKANNYIAVTALGLLLVVLVKFIFEWAVYNTGLTKGIEIKTKEVASDSIINKNLIEKRNLIKEIDSLRALRENLKESSKKG